MLSGLTPPDRRAGRAAAGPRLGCDAEAPTAGELRRVRVCPQHDILSHLTLEEHAPFFGRLKGKTKEAADRGGEPSGLPPGPAVHHPAVSQRGQRRS